VEGKSMIPTIGRIVLYRTTAQDASAINARRKDAREKMPWHHAIRSGAQVHVGNEVTAGDVFPLVITKVWGAPATEGTAFNGQLLLDGNDLYWVTSTSLGDGQARCFAPPRVEQPAQPSQAAAT
jgi:hypothetical protein